MRLYLVSHNDRDHGTVLSWHGTKREANAEAARLRRDYARIADVETVEVPTHKEGLISFLNDHANRDNG